jgi:acyl carrier protein
MPVEDRIEKVFAEIGIDKKELSPEATLKSGLGIDSTEMVELIVALEKEFSSKIPDGVINGGVTVGEIIDYFLSAADRS